MCLPGLSVSELLNISLQPAMSSVRGGRRILIPMRGGARVAQKKRISNP